MPDNTIDFRFDDIGPLRQGSVSNNNITVIYGFPNTGKSFALRSIYSMLSILDEESEIEIRRLLSQDIDRIIMETIEKELSEVENVIIELGNTLDNAQRVRSIYNANMSSSLLRKIVHTFVSKELTLEKDRIKFDFNRRFKLKIGQKELSKMFMADLKKFMSSIIGTINVEGLEFNGSKFFELIGDALSSLTLTSKKREGPKDISGTRRTRVIDFETPLRGRFENLQYQIIDVNEAEITLDVDGLFTADTSKFLGESKNSIGKRKLEIDEDYFDKLTRTISSQKRRQNDRLHETLFSSFYEYKRTSRIISRRVAQDVAFDLTSFIKSAIQNISNLEKVRFIPFGRTPLLQEAFEKQSSEEFFGPEGDHSENQLYNNYERWVQEGSKSLGKVTQTNQFKLLKFLTIQGSLAYDAKGKKLRYKDFRGKEVDINFASAMANELAGIMLVDLSFDTNGLLIIEEPESQLHPLAQIMMAFTLIAMAIDGDRIIFSTHSDILGQILFQVFELRPKKDDIVNLFSKILPETIFNQYIDQFHSFAEKIHTGIENLKTDTYFIDYDGVITPFSFSDLGSNTPGITNQVYANLANWVFNLLGRIEEDEQ